MNSSFKGMFNGDFFKKKSILSDADISSLQAYNAEIQRGVRPNIAFHKTMRESSVAAQNMAKSAKGAAVNLNAIPKVSRAATLGIKALSIAMNIGLMVGITTLISGITKMVGASEEMSQQASEATSKYKEQTSSIEEYKDKITELKTALSSENLTYADARDKRNQLLEVQKQLIDTYGDEAKGIDLVNGSLDSQIDKLEELNKQKRQEWENEVNKLSAGQQWQKWGGFAGLSVLAMLKPQEWFTNKTAIDWLNNFDNTTNIERIQKKIENFSKSIKFGSISDELKSQLDSFEGVSFDGLKMTISGDAKTVSETVTQIQTQVIGSREDLQWLNQDLKDIYNSAKKIVDENWDTYNTALQNQILDDKTGLEYYGKLTEAYETYQEAVKDGDENTINEAKEGYAKILSDIAGSDMSDSFKKFFENMYPDISDIVDDWKFEVNIVPKINTNKDGLKDDIETVKGLTTEEISAAFENNGTGVSKDQWKAITDLNAEAQANGLDLTAFLEQLREAGYLVSQLDKDIEKVVNDTKNKYGDGVDWGKYFKDNSIDTQEEIDKWNEVTNGIDNAEDAMNAYAEATKNANKMTVSIESLGKSLDNIQSAYDAVKSAISEYNEAGYLSVDTFQSLMELEPQYLNMLMDEHGNLNLNTEAVQENTAAYIENMGIKAAQNLIDTVSGLSGATAQLEYLTGATIENTGATWDNIYAQLAQAEAVSDTAVMAALKQRIFAIQSMTESAKRGIGKGGLSKDATKEVEQQKKHNLEILKDGLAKQEDIINRYKKNIELTDFGLELVDENDFSSRADLISDKLTQITAYGSAMREEFDRVASIIPNTADEAQELANRLENLGQEMRDNIIDLRETQIELQKLKIDAITALGTDSLGELESELDDIERRIEILNSDNKDGYQYTNQILSMKSLLPTRSDFNKQANEKRRQDKEIIKVEQETQDTINDIVTKSLEMQADENAKAREEERQALLKDLGNISNDYNTFLVNFENSTTTTTENVSNTYDTMASNIEDAFKRIETAMSFWGRSDSIFSIQEGTQKNILDAAKNYIGTPYVWGGESMSDGGFDCSGYVYNVLKDAGLQVQRETAQGYRSVGTKISSLQMAPGDLLFFGKKDGATHVAIYAGNGMMYESTGNSKNTKNNPGKGVVISPISKRKDLIEVRRLASGTVSSNGELALVGDDKSGKLNSIRPELIITKNGVRVAGMQGAEFVNLDKGDRVIPYEKTKQILARSSEIPRYAEGNWTTDFDSIIDGISTFTDTVLGTVGDIVDEARVKQLEVSNDKTIRDEDRYAEMLKIYTPIATEGARIGSEAYSQLTEDFVSWYNATKENPELWSQDVYDAFVSALDSIEDRVYDFEKNATDFAQTAVDSRWDISQNWINERNAKNDWRLFDDNEIAAWERVVKWLKEEYPNDLEKAQEAEQNLFDARKEEFSKATDLASSYFDSKSTLLQSYFDVINSIAEAQHEIDKELAASLTMSEYLDKRMRDLLFNQKDYNTLSEELYDIQYKADKLQREYQRALSGATLDTIEEITSNYEMQYETLMKSYEIAKAELEVAKKRQQLDNVLNERNVRMFINGQWQWVANTQDVINAQNEYADAKYEADRARIEKTQTDSLNNLTAQQDKLGTVINQFESGVIDLDTAVGKVAEMFGSLPSYMYSAFAKIQNSSTGYSSNGSSSSYSGNLPVGQIYRGDSPSNYGVSTSNLKTGQIYNGEWLKYKSVNAHATGTRFTPGGLTALGEIEDEMFITNNGHLIPINQPTLANIGAGGIVFNHDQMEFTRSLWDMANMSMPNYSNIINHTPQPTTHTEDNRIIINGMTVDSGSSDGQALINALRRYVGNH